MKAREVRQDFETREAVADEEGSNVVLAFLRVKVGCTHTTRWFCATRSCCVQKMMDQQSEKNAVGTRWWKDIKCFSGAKGTRSKIQAREVTLPKGIWNNMWVCLPFVGLLSKSTK